MTNEEILRKVIEKAGKNGFIYPDYLNPDELIFYLTKDNRGFEGYYSLIFDKDFAKAFWGEDIINIDFKQTIKDKNYKKVQTIILQDKAWRFHVSEMVKCEEPLKYLAKFLDNEE